jgi:prepilin-type N-terminal cleavage/methylation domain-containing protein
VRSSILRTADESGYSLVEVLVAMVVLTVAIVPMVGMFDAAIRAANASGAYDEARSCAVQKLEQAKSPPTRPSRTACRAASANLPDSGTISPYDPSIRTWVTVRGMRGWLW